MTREFDGKQGSFVAPGSFNHLSRKGEYLGYKKDMNFKIKIAGEFGGWALSTLWNTELNRLPYVPFRAFEK